MAIPEYLKKTYSWAYVNPRAIAFWDRPFIINFVLFGNYRRLRNRVLERIPADKKIVMLGSCYGDLIPRIHSKARSLTVVDCVQAQLDQVHKKCACDTILSDAKDSSVETGSADIVVLFFLLHELPTEWKSAVLAEAYRIAGTNGKVLICEFSEPYWWNALGYIERLIFKFFEPFAFELINIKWSKKNERYHFGGLYRIIETTALSAQHEKNELVSKAALNALNRMSMQQGIEEQNKNELHEREMSEAPIV